MHLLLLRALQHIRPELQLVVVNDGCRRVHPPSEEQKGTHGRMEETEEAARPTPHTKVLRLVAAVPRHHQYASCCARLMSG